VDYQHRIVDGQLDAWLPHLPAIAIEGAKGVGKTATATRRAADVFTLDEPDAHRNIADAPKLVLSGRAPTFVDEWQRVPEVWDVVRHAVDDDPRPGRFLLAGSALPPPAAHLHSGAGRIVRLLMRPLAMPERGVETPTVSFADLMAGERSEVAGRTSFGPPDYVTEILASGFPGIRRMPEPARTPLLTSYVDRIVDRHVAETGAEVRRPAALRAWLAAYAAATATTASYNAILRAATPGDADKPSRPTGAAYRELLERIWVLEPLPAWLPTMSHLKRLSQAPKHHLADPALAARLLGASAKTVAVVPLALLGP
jgi:predicted AAA+ superfamily ATPase